MPITNEGIEQRRKTVATDSREIAFWGTFGYPMAWAIVEDEAACLRIGGIPYHVQQGFKLNERTVAAWQCVESLQTSRELGLNRFVTEQPPYNLLDRRIERELIPMARTCGYGLIPWSPLAGGLLTGKYQRGEKAPDDARFSGREDSDRYNEHIFYVTEGLEPLVKEKDCTMAQFALAWCMHQPGIISPIIGPRTMQQLEDNLGALDVEITDEDRRKVDELIAPGRMVSPFYEADFGPHIYRT